LRRNHFIIQFSWHQIISHPNRFAKNPVNRCSAFVVGKGSRQPGAVTTQCFLFFFMASWSLHRPLSWIASQQANGLTGCHAPCSSSSFAAAAPMSFAALHSFAPHFATFHLVRS
jgi:hypothetical protein